MRTSDQRLTLKGTEPPAGMSPLMWLGVLGGACILAIHSFSGQAIDEATLQPAPMTGGTLSVLHAAIAAKDEDSAPTF